MSFDHSLAVAAPGVRFRHLAGEADADAIYTIHDRRRERDGLDASSLLEGLPTRAEAQATVNAALSSGTHDHFLFAEADGQPVGYTRFESWHERDGTEVYLTLGWVVPEWRGRGIGTALLHWCEDRIRRQAAADHPGGLVELAGNASSTETDATALLLDNGYHVAYTVLELRLDPAAPRRRCALPRGFELRPVLPEHRPLIVASVFEAYRDEYPGGRYSESDDVQQYLAELEKPRYDPAHWQVAWAGEEVAGQAMARIEGDRAEVFEVSVRPAWRRRGLARALLAAALDELDACQVSEVQLGTMAEFPTRAVDLYTSMGFRIVKTSPRYRKPLLV